MRQVQDDQAGQGASLLHLRALRAQIRSSLVSLKIPPFIKSHQQSNFKREIFQEKKVSFTICFGGEFSKNSKLLPNERNIAVPG